MAPQPLSDTTPRLNSQSYDVEVDEFRVLRSTVRERGAVRLIVIAVTFLAGESLMVQRSASPAPMLPMLSHRDPSRWWADSTTSAISNGLNDEAVAPTSLTSRTA